MRRIMVVGALLVVLCGVRAEAGLGVALQIQGTGEFINDVDVLGEPKAVKLTLDARGLWNGIAPEPASGTGTVWVDEAPPVALRIVTIFAQYNSYFWIDAIGDDDLRYGILIEQIEDWPTRVGLHRCGVTDIVTTTVPFYTHCSINDHEEAFLDAGSFAISDWI